MAEEKQETVDFTYTIDCTGSMSSYIQQIQADIEKIVDEMSRQFPAFKLRLGCVAYRDWCDKDKRLEYHDFTENIREFKEYVGNLKAFGGGDIAEDVLGGLNCAADLGWNSKLRVLFHICDAPPHNKIYHDISSDDYPNGHSSDPNNYHEMVLNKLKAKNIHLCIAKLQSNCDKMINVFQGYATRIGLTMEERNIKDVSELLNAVKQTLVILTKMRKEFKETEAEIDKISSSLDSLQHESNIFSKAVETKMQSIQGKIESINGTMINVGTMVADTKREYDELKSTHSIVMAYARNITSDDDIEKAEEKVVDLSEKLTTVHKKYNDADAKIRKGVDELINQQKTVHGTEESMVEKNKDKEKAKAQISGLIGKLNKMDKSENRQELQNEIKQKLKQVTKLFTTDMKIKTKIRGIKKSILAAFTEANARRKHINECKRDVESSLNELDEVLDELDDKLC